MIQKIDLLKDRKDNSLKSVFETEHKEIIEMTLLFNKDEIDVVCVPTHHYCNLGCKMCHLTNSTLQKKMIPIKYEDFKKALQETLYQRRRKRTNKKKLLISFMGVGESLLNLSLLEKIFQKEETLKKELGYEEISYAIASMIPNNNFQKLMSLVLQYEVPLKFHYSMHSPIDEKRKKLIPSTNITNEEALILLNEYRKKVRQNQKIMERYIKFHKTTDPTEIHYTLIQNINDTEEEKNALCHLLKKYQISIKFIKFNPNNHLEISKKETEWKESIKKELKDLRIKEYTPPGKEIGSSCGEFTKHYYLKEIETEKEYHNFLEWKKTHQVYE